MEQKKDYKKPQTKEVELKETPQLLISSTCPTDLDDSN